MNPADDPRELSDLGQPLDAFVIAYSDSAFTNPHEVVLPDAPKDCTGDFTHMGAKYWGLETRRHRATTVSESEESLSYDHSAHNWVDIGLKERSEISVIRVSTRYFTGNQARAISVVLKDEVSGTETQVLDRVSLDPDQEHEFKISPTVATECHVKIYYEGGISRINLFGEPVADQPVKQENLLEGATISHVSNEHYGKPDHAVAGVRDVMHMVGWESARTGFGEQALFHLRKPTSISEIVVDTYLHRLNPPLTCHVFALSGETEGDIDHLMDLAPRWKIRFESGKEVVPDDFADYMLEQRYLSEDGVENPEQFQIMLHLPEGSPWKTVLPFGRLERDTYHRFRDLDETGSVSHLLYMHYPNGGIHGLKVHGTEEDTSS